MDGEIGPLFVPSTLRQRLEITTFEDLFYYIQTRINNTIYENCLLLQCGSVRVNELEVNVHVLLSFFYQLPVRLCSLL